MCGEMGAYTDVVVLPLNGRCRTIDRCIHHIVSALNVAGVETTSCCCGHGKMPGRIDLADGRVLLIGTQTRGEDGIARVSLLPNAGWILTPTATSPAMRTGVWENVGAKEAE